jgi:hypothetical protein
MCAENMRFLVICANGLKAVINCNNKGEDEVVPVHASRAYGHP